MGYYTDEILQILKLGSGLYEILISDLVAALRGLLTQSCHEAPVELPAPRPPALTRLDVSDSFKRAGYFGDHMIGAQDAMSNLEQLTAAWPWACWPQLEDCFTRCSRELCLFHIYSVIAIVRSERLACVGRRQIFCVLAKQRCGSEVQRITEL